jgi:phenylalanyl-tRNA synthetase alpha chain
MDAAASFLGIGAIVAAMLAQLDTLESEAMASLGAAGDAAALEAWRIRYLGSNGLVKAAMAGLKDVPKDQKPAVGQRLNAVRAALEGAFKDRQGAIGGAAAPGAESPRLDLTEPGLNESSEVGRRHIISRVREELVEVFARMGFEVAQGPELEDDEHNFVKLNIPAHHPAREPSDNFYVDDPARVAWPRMLRSQTSTVQVRVMEEMVRRGGGRLAEPIRVIAPGRVYRPDTVDATHSFMFHQIEGLAVDRGISMADLKTTLLSFAKAYFGPEAQVRLRPSFFPFTEPSAELDMKIRLRPEDEPRWIELGGCGMVDPAVFAACGIDPEEWTGFAFGFGIERIAMGKYAIPDIRMLYENDLRFLSQL